MAVILKLELIPHISSWLSWPTFNCLKMMVDTKHVMLAYWEWS